MKILGIETSCDETAIAVLEERGGALEVLWHKVYSQVADHEAYGGVVPEVAGRLHLEKMSVLLGELAKNGVVGGRLEEVDLIAVTAGPGLAPALRVGVESAKMFAWQLGVGLVPVSHMEGHIYANWVGTHEHPEFPVLALLVSGGHTEFIVMRGHGQFERIGETLDDAVGEAFDKVAHMLGLPYPGGPAISRLAEQGNVNAFDFPRGLMNKPGYDFSFSGLKTAVLYALREHEGRLQSEVFKADISASFQEAVVDVLTQKTRRALKEVGARSLVVAGGVSANKVLRARMEDVAKEVGVRVFVPEFAYTMDNAVMIASAGYFRRGQALRGDSVLRLVADSHYDLTQI